MYIHEIDLHYHAGQERHESLYECLEHARITGRKILGVTDHLNFYVGSPPTSKKGPYENSIAGLVHYREELEETKKHFPTIQAYFTPEIPSRMDLDAIPREVIDLSDAFICEYPFLGASIEENTQAFVQRIREAREFIERTGKQTFIAHPFRNPINMRLVKNEIEPWVTALDPSPERSFTVQEVNQFMQLDVEQIGKAAADYDIPLEINGNTDERVRASNLPAAVRLFWEGFRVLHESGAQLVPGSDQHGFFSGKKRNRMGGYVPFEIFERLGIRGSDISYLSKLGVPIERASSA